MALCWRHAGVLGWAVLLVGTGTVGSAGCNQPSHERVAVSQHDCVVCHQAEYDGTTSPPHAGAFPTTCATCHTTDAWQPASFDHPWPLTGAHDSTPCASCHRGDPPVYAGTPTECVGCHLADYQSSPYPGHDAFPTICQDCHSTTAWTPAMGGAHPESRFPIQSGPHQGIACLDCHDPSLGSPVAGMNTDCVGCHTGEHTRSIMDAKHSEVRDYPTGPAAPNFCLDCHSSGLNRN